MYLKLTFLVLFVAFAFHQFMNTDSKTVGSAAADTKTSLHYDPKDPGLIAFTEVVDEKWIITRLSEAMKTMTNDAKSEAIETIKAAHAEVFEFDSLEAYKKVRDPTTKMVAGLMDAVKDELNNALAIKQSDPKFASFKLPPFVLTGSVVHDTSYPTSGDNDGAWVCTTKTEMELFRELFLNTFTTPSERKKGKAGTVLDGVVFFMGSEFKTKLGLPWIPFIYKDSTGANIKIDQTFRLKEQHDLIENAATRGYATRFNGDKGALLHYIHTQHFLAGVKSKLNDATLRALVEAMYAGNKAFLMIKAV